jgi:hypothetical protein
MKMAKRMAKRVGGLNTEGQAPADPGTLTVINLYAAL